MLATEYFKLAARITVPRAMKFIDIASKQTTHPDIARAAMGLSHGLENYATIARRNQMQADRAFGGMSLGQTALQEHARNAAHNSLVDKWQNFATEYFKAKKKPVPLMQGNTGVQIPSANIDPMKTRGWLQHLSFENLNNEVGHPILHVDPHYAKLI